MTTSEQELREKLSRTVEHDELGTYGETCDGQYECVCDDSFEPYKILTDELSLDEVLNIIKTHTDELVKEATQRAYELARADVLTFRDVWLTNTGDDPVGDKAITIRNQLRNEIVVDINKRIKELNATNNTQKVEGEKQ